MNTTNYKKGTTYIAISIVVAGAIVAGSIFLTSSNNNSGGTVSNNQAGSNNNNAASHNLDNFRLPDKNSHLKGNPDAKITIVEFSDFECPFCARLHPILTRLIDERNDVNWVYRHFPLSQIHSRALSASIASECVAKLGDNEAFWDFTDSLFLNQKSLGQALYEGEAQKLGINLNDFRVCIKDDNIAKVVRDDLNEATRSGGRGTPFSVLITPSGEFIPFSGAIPYESILALVEQALEN